MMMKKMMMKKKKKKGNQFFFCFLCTGSSLLISNLRARPRFLAAGEVVAHLRAYEKVDEVKEWIAY